MNQIHPREHVIATYNAAVKQASAANYEDREAAAIDAVAAELGIAPEAVRECVEAPEVA